ncbi:hypothetical protein I6U48_20950 [Clostridium sp. PL3]|uniref:Uncharacterized protein n=1 Tax=Clostridium thailandense TaxID=2794346 RepID=A0A949X5B6_9CLOT|nr:hypothetical protein [Clostridium thailandense]MBV7275373.1 hypothetical protein [Clostridium thailandense]
MKKVHFSAIFFIIYFNIIRSISRVFVRKVVSAYLRILFFILSKANYKEGTKYELYLNIVNMVGGDIDAPYFY